MQETVIVRQQHSASIETPRSFVSPFDRFAFLDRGRFRIPHCSPICLSYFNVQRRLCLQHGGNAIRIEQRCIDKFSFGE